MTGTPHLPRIDKRKRPKPRCLDCGETDRKKFYSHPTSRTGCQSRCKPCDNRKRAGYAKARGDGGRVDVERMPDGTLKIVRRPSLPSRDSNQEKPNDR